MTFTSEKIKALTEEFRKELENQMELYQKNPEKYHVTISGNNRKMGNIASVSTLPFITCPYKCSYCYAAKMAMLYPSVRKSYAKNTAIMILDRTKYFREIEQAIKNCVFFRFHVSGDIFDYDYFTRMCEIARRNPHCKMIAFTKHFKAVNKWLSEKDIPENLKVMFSGDSKLKPVNPYGMPETTIFEDISEISENWNVCPGNCFNCAESNQNCYNVKKGETIAFKKH